MVVLVGATTFNAMRREALPACSSAEVTEVLVRLLPGSGDHPTRRSVWKAPTSVTFASCNATVAGSIQPYRVTWYSSDKGPDHRYLGDGLPAGSPDP